MATAKKLATPAKAPVAKNKAPAAKKVAAPKATATKPTFVMKPIKERFTKVSLVAHLAQASGIEAKEVKKVVAALEATLLASIDKKGAGEFTLPGVVRITAQKVPAKKARKGINPFTGQETTFKAKPASVKLKARFFKKVKEAAI